MKISNEKERFLSYTTSLAFKSLFKREGHESIALTLVELVLELNPMKTESVEEAFKDVHAHKDTESKADPHEVADPYL